MHSLSAFKSASIAAVRYYFDSSDVDEAVTLALDRKDLLTEDQLSMGFTRLLAAADDLALDCPDVVLKSLRADSVGVSVVISLSSLLATRHSSERLSNCWHDGSREKIKEQIHGAIKEFTSSRDVSEASKCVAIKEFTTSRDVAEASKCVRELNVPYYHHQVVVTAMEAAFEKVSSADDILRLLAFLSATGVINQNQAPNVSESSADDILLLLASLFATGVINQTQMSKGFFRLKTHMVDEALDYGSKAKDAFPTYVKRATDEGWLVVEA
eukprot:gene6508-3146_t